MYFLASLRLSGSCLRLYDAIPWIAAPLMPAGLLRRLLAVMCHFLHFRKLGNLQDFVVVMLRRAARGTQDKCILR